MSLLLESVPQLAAPLVDAATVTGDMDVTSDDSVLGKVQLLLGVFSPAVTCLGLTDLSRRSGVPKATVYRLARQLVDLGFLSKTARGYQLGWQIFEMGQMVPGPARLCSVSRPSLIDLRVEANALVVHLAVLRGDDCLYLERLAGRREIGLLGPKSVSSSSASSGRVILAYRDIGQDPRTLFQAEVKAGTWQEELEAIRERRWDVERGRSSGLKTLSVPVMYPDGRRVVAAVGATVPIERKDDQSILHALWAAAADVTRGLHHLAAPRPKGERHLLIS